MGNQLFLGVCKCNRVAIPSPIQIVGFVEPGHLHYKQQ
jgi:hypothetical protein